MCSIKLALVFFSVLVVLQINIEARSITNEAIVKKKLEEVRNLLIEIKNKYFAILERVEGDFVRNFTKIYKHGNAGTEYLLGNLELEIVNLQAEADQQGVNIDECVKTTHHLMEVLPEATARTMLKLLLNFLQQYDIIHRYFVNNTNNVQSALNTLELVLNECPVEDEDCYDEVLQKLILWEELLNNDFICDFETIIREFLTCTETRLVIMKEDFDKLHKDIERIDEEFLQCCADQFP